MSKVRSRGKKVRRKLRNAHRRQIAVGRRDVSRASPAAAAGPASVSSISRRRDHARVRTARRAVGFAANSRNGSGYEARRRTRQLGLVVRLPYMERGVCVPPHKASYWFRREM